jgi:hypothetical protein
VRFFVAFLITLSCLYLWDDEYNSGKLFEGIRHMGRDMSRSIGY